jgi:hypothetical protein
VQSIVVSELLRIMRRSFSDKRIHGSLGGFAPVSRETAKRASATLVWKYCGSAALSLAGRYSKWSDRGKWGTPLCCLLSAVCYFALDPKSNLR